MGQGTGLRWVRFVFLASIPVFDLQINPFRPSPSHSTTDRQSLRFCVKIFSLSAIVGGPRKKKYSQGFQLALGGHAGSVSEVKQHTQSSATVRSTTSAATEV
jgi:hypothetical protein